MDETVKAEGSGQSEVSGEMNFQTGSKRASTRPRRKGNNAVAEESNVAIEEDGRNNNLGLEKGDKKELEYKEGQLEEAVKRNPFPFGSHVSKLIHVFTIRVRG